MPNITRQQIVEAALSFAPNKAEGRAGVPYKAGGQDRNGMSCAGLMVGIGHETDYLQEEIPGFSSFNEAEPMSKWFGKYMDEIPVEEAREGDVLSMDFGEGEQHCAVMVRYSERGIKYCYFVHALRNHGVVEGRLFGPYLSGVKNAYRLKGLID